MNNSQQNIYVICNWNHRAAEIISELRADVLQKAGEYPPVVVVHDEKVDLDRYHTLGSDRYRFVEFVLGDPGNVEVLRRAGVARARSVIILRDDRLEEEADSQSLMVMLGCVRCIEEELKNSLQKLPRASWGQQPLRELLNQAGAENLRIPNVLLEYGGQFGDIRKDRATDTIVSPHQLSGFSRKLADSLEILSISDIRSKVFAQSGRSPCGGLISVYDTLLTFGEEDCEVYLTEIQGKAEWTHFAHYARAVLQQTAATGETVIPVGLFSGNDLYANPRGALSMTESVRRIAVLSYDPPEARLDLQTASSSTRAMAPVQPPVATAVDTPLNQEAPMEEPRHNLSKSYMQNHYIICHWNERAAEIIGELRAHEQISEGKNRADRVPVVVLTRKQIATEMLDDIWRESGEKSTKDKEDIITDVYFRPGDPASAASLKQVNAYAAKTIIILADEKGGPLADARTLQCLMAIQEAVGSESVVPHVVAEILDVNNYAKFKEFERQTNGAVEVIRGESLRTRILAQAARTPGLVDFYYDLLTHSDDSNELYELPVESLLQEIRQRDGLDKKAGIPFPDVARHVLDKVILTLEARAASPTAAKNEPPVEVIPVGVWRDHKTVVNPLPRHPEYELVDTDRLVVISYHPPQELMAKGEVVRAEAAMQEAQPK